MTDIEHVPHILPLRTYLIIGGILLVLTAVTVIVAVEFEFGGFNLVVAMLIAVLKATLVALFFMHLKYDNKIYATIFVGSLLFLGIFISLTMFDVMRRGDLSAELAGNIKKHAIIYPASAEGDAFDDADSTEFELESDYDEESWGVE